MSTMLRLARPRVVGARVEPRVDLRLNPWVEKNADQGRQVDFAARVREDRPLDH
jgi:hypothetical protein